MAGPSVQVSAAKTDRSLVAKAPLRKGLVADAPLKFWRWLINSAVADAKRTKHGMPTNGAILARWWIEEHKPAEAEREEWERSFECACKWLNVDPSAERVRVLAVIDVALMSAYVEYVRAAVYVRRAAVLSCAGHARAIRRQYELPLVAELDFEQVAGIEHGDPPARVRRLKLAA